jgi:hypothetical protein
LKVAFRAQSQIGWENLLKRRMSRDWLTCIDPHFQENGSKLAGQECIAKLIMELWDHIARIWTYRRRRYNENTNQQVVRYKTEALIRRYEEIWEKHAGLIERVHIFQTKHFEDIQSIGNLHYESKCFLAIYELRRSIHN